MFWICLQTCFAACAPVGFHGDFVCSLLAESIFEYQSTLEVGDEAFLRRLSGIQCISAQILSIKLFHCFCEDCLEFKMTCKSYASLISHRLVSLILSPCVNPSCSHCTLADGRISHLQHLEARKPSARWQRPQLQHQQLPCWRPFPCSIP